MDAFDADVLIYAAADQHPLGRRVRALFAAEPGSRAGVGSVLLVPEILAKPMREGHAEELTALAGLLSRLDLRILDAVTAEVATSLAATHRLRAADAVHLATALVAGADRFVTNNRRDFPDTLPDITVTYHRPVADGRTIWGGVVPYDQMWRTGANENTTISFSDDVQIEGRPLAAGTYGLHTIPGRDAWTIVFSNNAHLWGSFNYDESEDALRVTVTPRAADHQEVFLITMPEVTPTTAEVLLHWGEVQAGFTVEVDVPALVLAGLRRDLRGVAGFNPVAWRQAAAYAMRNSDDLDEALAWIDRAQSAQPAFANLAIKAGIYERMGRAEEAEALIAEALPTATEAEVNTYGYQLLGGGHVDRAIEVFRYNVAQHPDSWNVYDSLGEALAQKGETRSAIEHYEKALAMVEDPNQQTRIRQVLAQLRESS